MYKTLENFRNDALFEKTLLEDRSDGEESRAGRRREERRREKKGGKEGKEKGVNKGDETRHGGARGG